MNLIRYLEERLGPARSESSLHPHVATEQAELFRTYDPGGAELETLSLLHSLVLMTKPRLALETGTGSGLSAFAIASGLEQNGFGQLLTIDSDSAVSQNASALVRRLDPLVARRVEFAVAHSIDLIKSLSVASTFDYVFFDSILATRPLEYRLLEDGMLLSSNAICIFHDTSVERKKYMDYSDDLRSLLTEETIRHSGLEFPLSRGLCIVRRTADHQ